MASTKLSRSRMCKTTTLAYCTPSTAEKPVVFQSFAAAKDDPKFKDKARSWFSRDMTQLFRTFITTYLFSHYTPAQEIQLCFCLSTAFSHPVSVNWRYDSQKGGAGRRQLDKDADGAIGEPSLKAFPGRDELAHHHDFLKALAKGKENASFV